MALLKKRQHKKESTKKYGDQYYHLDDILELDALYNVIYGERSNGKTYSGLELAIKRYFDKDDKYNGQFAYIRRMREDIVGKRGASVFQSIVANGLIEMYSGGEYNSIEYYRGRFYLIYYDNETRTKRKAEEPIGYVFALSDMEHDKSTSYPNVKTIIFDEFLTRTTYLRDEFVLFCNVVSTIIRQRNDVQIFMFGNTVNKFCPYFAEMGLKHAKSMKPGDIDLYKYNDDRLRVAVERTGGDENNKGKPSDAYFAFDNPKLNMITHGDWEFDIYPHLHPFYNYKPKDIRITYYIKFNDEVLRCDVIKIEKNIITYIHRQTREIIDEDKHYIYSLEQSMKPNYYTAIMKPETEIQKFIWSQFLYERVYYEDNEVGDIVSNYLKNCKRLI